jgi:hypothetical protein
MKRVLAGAAVVVAIVAAGCGGRQPNALSIRVGMTRSQVVDTAGAPVRPGPRCWLYRASKRGTAIDAVRVCFAGAKVAHVQTGVHG